MIGIVSCSATKLDRPAQARELYTSPLFKLSLQYAERHCSAVYIASARHGLVALDCRIEPYNETLAGKSKEQRGAWGFMVARQLEPLVEMPARVLVLAGEAYVAPLRWHLDDRIELLDVLWRMQIGQRLQFLRQRLDERRAA